MALALAASPRLLVLDDPTLGLDAVARKAVFEELIGDLADRGTTVFITTHDLAGVERIADRVGILREGRLVLDEEMEALKARFRRVSFPRSREAAVGRLTALAPVAVASRGWEVDAVVSRYAEEHLPVEDGPEVSSLTLEEIFIALTGGMEGERMRGFVAVLRREVFERRLLVLLALALGLIAVALPLLPGFQPGGVASADLQGGMALGLRAPPDDDPGALPRRLDRRRRPGGAAARLLLLPPAPRLGDLGGEDGRRPGAGLRRRRSSSSLPPPCWGAISTSTASGDWGT